MKLLTISIVMSCNYRCYYCPVLKWLQPIDHLFSTDPPTNGYPINGTNCINNESLLKWLDKYINPETHIIEITGGEPGLYKEIDSLIPELNKRGYHGLIKTNGTLPIPKSKNIQIIATWHEGKEFPKYYDQILIMKNPNDNWKQKKEYCERKNIPYKLTLFNESELDKTTRGLVCKKNHFEAITHVNNQGQVIGCPSCQTDYTKNIFVMTPPIYKDLKECPRCKGINDNELFLSAELMNKVKLEYERVK